MRYTLAMITKKKCENESCNKEFYGTKSARFCCGNCRLKKWRKKNEKNEKNDGNYR